MGRRHRPGYSRVDVEMPDDVLAGVKAAADAAGESLYTFITKAAAKRAGVPFTPTPPGRPPKPAAPKKRGGRGKR